MRKNFSFTTLASLAIAASLISVVQAAPLPVTSGLQFRVDASAITGLNAGDLVSTWSDISGNSRHAVSRGGVFQDPTYQLTSFFPGGPTKSVVRFNTADGNDSLQLELTDTVSLFGGGTDWTTFVVFAKNSPNTSGFGLIGSAGNPSIGINLGSRNDTSLTITYSGYGDRASAPYHDGSTKIYDLVAWTHDNTLQVDTAYQNSNLVATGGFSNSPTTSNALVLGTFDGNGGFLNGDIAEIIVYNQKLNSSDFTSVSDYLTAKWLPEPGSLGVLVIGAMFLVRRRVVRA